VTSLALAAAVALGLAFAGGVAAARSRVPRLVDRVGPYRPGSAGRPGASAGAAWTTDSPSGWVRRVVRSGATPQRRAAETSSARAHRPGMAARLRAAGLDESDADEYRLRQFAQSGAIAVGGVVLGGVVLRSPVLTIVLAVSGAAVGVTRGPARLARMAEARRVRMRLELVTIDQVLAIHVRAGAGPVQAVTRVVERGHGVVVEELRAVLASIRAGRGEAEAFRHAARGTSEPHAARTYRLFALASEQGADLGTALRALSEDLRDVRRDELRRQATRRRAAMLVPTIAVLAPVMLLFVIAPLPSLVLGGR